MWLVKSHVTTDNCCNDNDNDNYNDSDKQDRDNNDKDKDKPMRTTMTRTIRPWRHDSRGTEGGTGTRAKRRDTSFGPRYVFFLSILFRTNIYICIIGLFTWLQRHDSRGTERRDRNTGQTTWHSFGPRYVFSYLFCFLLTYIYYRFIYMTTMTRRQRDKRRDRNTGQTTRHVVRPSVCFIYIYSISY